MQDDNMYTLKHTVSSDTLVASLPIIEVHSDAGYNCCVEAVFETYSSKACNTSTVLCNQVSLPTVSTKSESSMDVPEPTTTKTSLNTNAQQELS